MSLNTKKKQTGSQSSKSKVTKSKSAETEVKHGNVLGFFVKGVMKSKVVRFFWTTDNSIRQDEKRELAKVDIIKFLLAENGEIRKNYISDVEVDCLDGKFVYCQEPEKVFARIMETCKHYGEKPITGPLVGLKIENANNLLKTVTGETKTYNFTTGTPKKKTKSDASSNEVSNNNKSKEILPIKDSSPDKEGELKQTSQKPSPKQKTGKPDKKQTHEPPKNDTADLPHNVTKNTANTKIKQSKVMVDKSDSESDDDKSDDSCSFTSSDDESDGSNSDNNNKKDKKRK